MEPSQVGPTGPQMGRLRTGFASQGYIVTLFTLGAKHLVLLPQAANTKVLAEWKSSLSQRCDWKAREADVAAYLRALHDEVGGLDGEQPCPGRAVCTLAFADPAAPHLGLHPKVMQTLLDGRHAEAIDDLIVEQIRWILSFPPGSTIDLVLYCTSGRHRSVATSLFLFGALAKLGIKVAVSHMSERWWGGVACQRPWHGCTLAPDRALCGECVSQAATDAQNALLTRHWARLHEKVARIL